MRPACKLLTVSMLLLAACAPPPDTARFKIDFERGVKAYEAGDYEAARMLWPPLADHDDLAALRSLGHPSPLAPGVA